VRCQYVFKAGQRLQLHHWVFNPVLKHTTGPGSTAPVKVTLFFQSSKWDTMGYVRSQAALSVQSAATTPAAAAGSSAAVTRGSSKAQCGTGRSATTTYGPVPVYAQHFSDGIVHLSKPNWSTASLRSVVSDYADGSYAVVLQEQVGPTTVCVLLPHRARLQHTSSHTMKYKLPSHRQVAQHEP
jgi:hypothetical protein